MVYKIGQSDLLREHGDLSFLFIFFERVLGREHLGKVKKKSSATFISEEPP